MRRFLVVTLSLLIYMALGASPARTGRITLTQPDGSRFSAVFAGDEFMKIKMTESGEAIIQEARAKQAELLKEAAATRDSLIQNAQQKAREESARLLEEAKAEIESEKQAAINDIKSQVAALSVEIAEKVLRSKLSDDKAQMDLIDNMLDEVSSFREK